MAEEVTITSEQFDSLVKSADQALALQEELKAVKLELAELRDKFERQPRRMEDLPAWKQRYLKGYFGLAKGGGRML